MMLSKLGFIGLGHIGGSIAKTIRRIHPDTEQIAFDTDAKTLQLALEDGTISEGYDHLSEDFSTCDCIFLCAPVLNNSAYVKQMQNLIHDDMILTDVGSVKTGIHETVHQYPDLEAHFIGGHPMCGTEHIGYSFSTAYMLENAYYVLTPSDTVPAAKVDQFKDFIASIGALPIILDYRHHDHVVGTISHLPHVISASLVNLVKDTDDPDETMRTIAAGGFKDITRISSSSPVMWENICIANQKEILSLIDTYIKVLKNARQKIASGDGQKIREFFQSAKDYRDSFAISRSSGPIQPVYQLFCDLIDEAGGIATIATILASNNISIKNIGIIHNREFEQGVLQVEFYTQDAYDHAILLLRKYHYTVYEK